MMVAVADARIFVRYTVDSVQRSLATLLCTLFMWLVVLPLLLPSADAFLPECCRKNGKHHCMLAGGRSSAASPTITSAKGKCPLCPTMAANSSQAHAGAPAAAAAIFAGLVRHPAVSPQVEAGYRISRHRARQKRGPPSSLLA